MRLFEDLVVSVGGRAVLLGGSLDVSPGEVLVLAAPSGAGKSVLAEVAFGLAGPGSGISWSGQLGEARDRGVLVFQHADGFAHLSLLDNLLLVRHDPARALQVLSELGLPPDRSGAPLSGGERRRLAVARALVAERPLLWLDEPAAGLDVLRVSELAATVRREAAERGVAFVITSHRPEFIDAVADRVVLLRDGQLVEGAGRPRGPEALAGWLADHLSESPGGGGAGQPRPRLSPLAVVDVLAQARGLMALHRSAPWRTLGQSLRLAGWEGAAFYPFVGAIFGAIFVLAIQLSLDVAYASSVLLQYGPTLVLRFAPAMGAVLVAARAGASVASWLGQLTVGRQLDGLRLVAPRAVPAVLGPAWAGLVLASCLSTATFAAALAAVFVGYAAWDGHPSPVEGFLAGFEARPSGAAALKVGGYALLLSAITIASAVQSKIRVERVASDLTRGIVLSTVGVLLAEAAALLAERCS